MENFKISNTERIVQDKYHDILYAKRPKLPVNRPRMSLINRAKIFSPFAALRGFEEEIISEDIDHLRERRIYFSDEEVGKIEAILSRLTKGQSVTITYFAGGQDEYGFYQTIKGKIISVDIVARSVVLNAGMKSFSGKELSTIIPFNNILKIDAAEST